MNQEDTYVCETCRYRGNTITVIQHHILDKHIHPDKDGRIACDECEAKFASKDEFWENVMKFTNKELFDCSGKRPKKLFKVGKGIR